MILQNLLDLNTEVACLRRAIVDSIERNAQVDSYVIQLIVALRHKERELMTALDVE